ncbi:DUF1345 domain-containing protein [Plantibacter sp. YIM 135347]|uniref:DUF1345 domain-containing protein n=1 Tax=Plantibacter sp. YIM 135347 TaxID=3423919 RepID=UPI003D3266AC
MSEDAATSGAPDDGVEAPLHTSETTEPAEAPAAAEEPAATPARVIAAPRTALSVIGFSLNLLTQLAMVVIGFLFISADDYGDGFWVLLLWCTLGTLYAVTVIVVLWRLSARDEPATEHRMSRLALSRPARIVSTGATILASFVGLGAAVELLALRSEPGWQGLIEVIGVWAMLLAWGFLHWGFAQIYSQGYYANPAVPTLRFPNTPFPTITDFVYFAFTIGTTFATSDVETLRPLVRWRIVWHSVLSFFFNGLIIVLALNTITGSSGAPLDIRIP